MLKLLGTNFNRKFWRKGVETFSKTYNSITIIINPLTLFRYGLAAPRKSMAVLEPNKAYLFYYYVIGIPRRILNVHKICAQGDDLFRIGLHPIALHCIIFWARIQIRCYLNFWWLKSNTRKRKIGVFKCFWTFKNWK